MKNRLFLSAIICLLILASGCNRILPGMPKVDTASKSGYDFVAIKNPQLKAHNTLSVYIPGDWQEVKRGMILYYLPPGSVATDTVAEKVVISAYSMPKNNTSTLAEFMKEDLTANRKGVPGLQFVTSTEPVKVGPLTGREEKYINQIIGKRILITQVDARSGGILYKLQHYCVENACQDDAIFAEMAGSFAVEPANYTGK